MEQNQNMPGSAPGTYVLLMGNALDPKAPKSIKIDGTLPAPFEFLSGKTVEDEAVHLLIFKDKGQLELHIHDTDPYTEHVIKGSLKRDSILDQFKINSDKRWNTQEFLKFIRTMKYYFPDKGQHAKLIESLTKWTAKIEVVLNENQDTKGNSSFSLERKVREVPLDGAFKLEVAIFQGYEKSVFTVEIGLDPKALQVDIYLISDELIELETSRREKIIETEIEKFGEYEFSKVVVS